MNKIKKALNSFNDGFNCAQSILIAFEDEDYFISSQALDLASGFGGGMGRLQETCGAVTGAFMVIGIYNSHNIKDIELRKEVTTDLIQQFSTKFISRNGTLKCSELLNCDLKTNLGQELFVSQNLGEKVCSKCISDSIQIVDELINISTKYS